MQALSTNDRYNIISKVGAQQAALYGAYDVGVLGRIFNRDIGGFGDSFTANCHSIAATAYATENYGYLGNVAAMSGTAFASYLNNFGVVGENTSQFLARIAAPLASFCQIFLMPSVTNDRTQSGMTLADTKRNVLDIVEQFTKAGKLIIVGTGTPRFGTKALSAQAAQDAYDYRTWVLTTLSKQVPVVNIWDDFTQADTVDDLHPNPIGAVKIATKFNAIITQLQLKSIPLPTDALDKYSALSRTGSLTANPLLATTNGTGTIQASANPIAGSLVADDWTILGSGLTGVSVAASVKPASVGNAQSIKLSGAMTAAGGYFSFQPLVTIPTTNFSVGDTIGFVAACSVQGTQKGLLSAELELIIVKPVSGTSTTIYYRAMDKYQTGFPMNANSAGVLETQRYVIDGTETSIRVRATGYLETSVAQDQEVSISQIATRKY